MLEKKGKKEVKYGKICGTEHVRGIDILTNIHISVQVCHMMAN